ncbi:MULTISPECIES: sensor histidine kinase [Mycobacterium]|uniref:histidine kinase n=1 Tax=Mycobacterium kiyosense TaxID=2871094 RepID=A0A9P3Q9B1_9MYCO|nr:MULTISPECIES: HAMP domain-containing sensor histidine kinase [Mycobacterium]BDB44658.1 two-component sensor histidine kinase [Mycobacterium kiyosense]BDE16159.1 two-component sensor histidine kinase [Mycobacterium sp. 20KCMC460]GLB82170.1 two-component sensor histidine kinase [Mycobacterium kiyosense]GLB90539.1 two-component sensor histidine kinase [Mycobacterium kiyosense]GLB95312.1 two-component sensor histidine kinase [Mycobacterium kiyosense]
MTGERYTPRWFPRSLRRQLLLGVLAVVSVVLVAVGVVSVLTLRGYVTSMNDAEVAESMHAFSHAYARYRNGEHTSVHRGIPPVSQAVLEFTGQTPGNLIAVLRDGKVIASAVFSEDEPRPAPPDVVRAIEAQSWTDGPSRVETLGSLGPHQVDSRAAGTDRLVVGVSLSMAEAIIARKQLTTTALVATALLVTAALTAWVVGYALRPLSRVAATAAEVAAMPLADEDHQIRVRVRPEDTDPDNEVGIVGHTLNKLLDNVESALAHRVESDMRMRQFITDASHELRTPLAAIQGYAELTRQDSSNLPPTTEYALARIESEARRMASLVDELLLLSRLGEGQDLQTEELDFADLVINAVNDAAVAAPTHNWATNLPDEPVWVNGDHARLHQLLANLLTNAWVHTPPDVTVTTAITRHPASAQGLDVPYAELTVTDNGPDIDPEVLPHLFERFVRADKSRSNGSGHGLGLAIVNSIVKAHGGTVAAESANGITVFRVRLPMIDTPGPRNELGADHSGERAASLGDSGP